MKQSNCLNPDRLAELSQEIFDIACAHGWHEEHFSESHWLCLVMTEMAEAVEADRKNQRADMQAMNEAVRIQQESKSGLTEKWYRNQFPLCYTWHIKGSLEEEFADIVIRLLDMAKVIHGKKMVWKGCYPFGSVFSENRTFPESAWFFISEVLNRGTMNISDSVSYIYDWAEHLGIDLDQHIEWKMKYNQFRPYKHGGKKY